MNDNRQHRARQAIATLLCSLIFLQVAATAAPADNMAAQPAPTTIAAPTFMSDFFKDEADMWTAPVHWQARDWLLAGAVTALVGVAIAYDEQIYRAFKRFQGHNPWVSDFSPVITQLGNLGVALGIDALLYVTGAIIQDAKAKETAEMGLQALIHTGILVQVMKHFASRSRPSVDNGIDHWYGPEAFFLPFSGNQSKYDAFPSGHTITVFGLATVIGEQYRETVWVPVLCYSLATLTGLSRVTEDTHWFSDVILGGVLGFAVGKMVVRNHHSRHLLISPAVGAQSALLSIQYVF